MAAAVMMLAAATAANTSAAAAARAEKEKLKSSSPRRTCSVCGAKLGDEPLGCGYCRRAAYCGRRCQEKDWRWRKHKGECCSMWPASVVASEIAAARDTADKKSKDGGCYCDAAALAATAIGIDIHRYPEVFRRIYEPIATNPFSVTPELDKIFASVPIFALDYEDLSPTAKYQADDVPVGMVARGLVLIRYPNQTRRGGPDGFELVRDYLTKNPKKAELLAKSVRRRLYGSIAKFPAVPKAAW